MKGLMKRFGLVLVATIFALSSISCEKATESKETQKAAEEISQDIQSQQQITEYKEVVMWNEMNFAPHFILDGPYKGMGFGDKVIPILIEAFPEYQHRRFSGNTALMLERSKNDEHVCTINFIKTEERKKYIYFSLPYIFVLPNGLIIREEDKSKFDKYIDSDGKVSLASLLEKSDLKFGVSGKTAYGKGVDPIIAANKDNPNVVARFGKDLTEGLLQMLDLKRIDYMLTYPDMRSFLTKKLNIQSKLRYIPVAEMPKDYLLEAHVACARNAWGEELIAKVDSLITDTDLIDKTADYYSYWLDENDKQIYQERFQRVVKKKPEQDNNKAVKEIVK